MKYGPENAQTISLLKSLEHAASVNKAPVWNEVAKLLKRPRRKKVAVNLAKVAKLAKPGSTIVVPGRLLSVGPAPEVEFTLAVQSSSEAARKKLAGKKVKLTTIAALLGENPKGSNVRIVI